MDKFFSYLIGIIIGTLIGLAIREAIANEVQMTAEVPLTIENCQTTLGAYKRNCVCE